MRNTLFNQPATQLLPNKWDLFALFLVFSVLLALAWTGTHLSGKFSFEHLPTISLSAWYLPRYALETVLRMFIALLLSFIFSFIIGAIAAKSTRAGKVIIPIIDILQSVPILGYLSILIVAFVALFPGSLLGPQFAAIFAVFTSQVWNMTLSFYQSLRTVPKELNEAAHMYQLSSWQRFWKLEVPFAMPGLLWNAMMSMSGSWFFVVASEAISVGNHEVMLPGIGSYIQTALNFGNAQAIVYALVTMLIVILLYDQLLFRPLVAWSEKFLVTDIQEQNQSSWFLNIMKRAPWMKRVSYGVAISANHLTNINLLRKRNHRRKRHLFTDEKPSSISTSLWYLCLFVSGICFFYIIWQFIYANTNIGITDTLKVFLLGFYTGARVFILIIICSFIWIPIGIWIGTRPKIAQAVQPIAQILAAFPANLLYGPFAIIVIAWQLNFEIWCAPLMVLGTQWYILFNVIAGASAIPQELKLASDNLQLSGWAKWTKYLIPSVFPFYVTGAITAAGGSWNASIVAEVIDWNHQQFNATGLGAYITENTTLGHMPEVALGVIVMCFWVTLVNRLFWRRLYRYAETRYKME
ncbi:ABC transporter permease subunit [Thiotrichales bacterium 19S9-12]|nr:ABC transporter permease subunit [Thiotrichales bacterium 19S9-11]MCF6811482.1 ABC transporter permease subunit [Thiotrichales bacterium 19S9-12]